MGHLADYPRRPPPRRFTLAAFLAVTVTAPQRRSPFCFSSSSAASSLKDEIVDASDFLSCHGRYINDCIVDLENVKMKVIVKRKEIDIITLRVIKKDEEILTDYGPAYWEGSAAAMHNHDTNKTFCIKVAEMKKRKLDCVDCV